MVSDVAWFPSIFIAKDIGMVACYLLYKTAGLYRITNSHRTSRNQRPSFLHFFLAEFPPARPMLQARVGSPLRSAPSPVGVFSG